MQRKGAAFLCLAAAVWVNCCSVTHASGQTDLSADLESELSRFRDSQPVAVEKEYEKPVFVEKVVEVEKVVLKEVVKEVPITRYVEEIKTKVIEIPKFVEKVIEVEKVKVIPVEKVIEIVIEKPVFVDREVILDKVKYREVVVDVIKPHYVCQACGKEV